MKTRKTSPPANPKGTVAHPTTSAGRAQKGKNKPTVIWGRLEKNNFMMLPKVVLSLGRHSSRMGEILKPRHILLLLALMSRQYHDKPVRAYWETLAVDLGVKQDTVRKWAYQLKNAGYLKITPHRGRDPERNRPGMRNEANSFDYSAFVSFVQKMDEKRLNAKAERAAK